MGFGFLFLGYLISFLFTMSPVGFITDIFGYGLILWGMNKLRVHNHFLNYAFFASGVLALYSVSNTVLRLTGLSDIPLCGDILAGVKISFVLLFHAFLLAGIRMLGNSCELPKIAGRAKANLIMTALYYVFTFAGSFLIPPESDAARLWSLPLFIFGIIWLIMNVFLIHSCYMWICLEGDEDMEAPASSIPFINSMNDLLTRSMKKKEADGKAAMKLIDDAKAAEGIPAGKKKKKKKK